MNFKACSYLVSPLLAVRAWKFALINAVISFFPVSCSLSWMLLRLFHLNKRLISAVQVSQRLLREQVGAHSTIRVSVQADQELVEISSSLSFDNFKTIPQLHFLHSHDGKGFMRANSSYHEFGVILINAHGFCLFAINFRSLNLLNMWPICHAKYTFKVIPQLLSIIVQRNRRIVAAIFGFTIRNIHDMIIEWSVSQSSNILGSSGFWITPSTNPNLCRAIRERFIALAQLT